MRTPSLDAAPGNLPSLPTRLSPGLPALGVASLLAAGTNAYGQIVYSGAINTLVSSGSVNFNIDGIGINEFSLTSGGGEGGYIKFGSVGYAAAGLVTGAFVTKLTGGTAIGSGSSTWDSTGLTRVVWQSLSGFGGGANWGDGTESGQINGYVGFLFSPSSGGTPLLYGWMELALNVTGGAGMATANVLGYAYEASGGSIQAGAIPEPSAAALVIGAAALLALRQRRRKAA